MSYVPNEYARVGENLSNMLVQLFIENRRFAQNQQQIDLEGRRVSVAEQGAALERQTQALNRAAALAPFLPMGKPISEMPEVQNILRDALPEFEVDNPESVINQMVLNPETMEQILRPAIVASYRSLPEAERKKVDERGMFRAITGEAVSADEMELQEQRTAIGLRAFQQLTTDPIMMQDVIRGAVGLDPKVRVQHNGRIYEFNTQADASLTIQLMMHRESLAESRAARQAAAAGGDTISTLSTELMKQVSEGSDGDIQLGRAGATQIVQAYAAGEEAWNRLYESANPSIRAGMDVFRGAANFGQDATASYLSQTPQGRQTLNALTLSEQLEERFGKEAGPEILESMIGRNGILSGMLDENGEPAYPVFNRGMLGPTFRLRGLNRPQGTAPTGGTRTGAPSAPGSGPTLAPQGTRLPSASLPASTRAAGSTPAAAAPPTGSTRPRGSQMEADAQSLARAFANPRSAEARRVAADIARKYPAGSIYRSQIEERARFLRGGSR